jgi:hypothetical protein
MELSDELFADIRKTLRLGECDDSACATSGRRAGRMDAAQVKVEIEHVGARQGRHVITLLDLAKRGVSLLDNRAWGAGEKFVMYLPRSSSHMLRFLCVVRNSRVVEGQFRIGAEFVDEREAHSTMVIRSAQAMAAGSRRRSCRRGYRSQRRAARAAQALSPRPGLGRNCTPTKTAQPGPILEATWSTCRRAASASSAPASWRWDKS